MEFEILWKKKKLICRCYLYLCLLVYMWKAPLVGVFRGARIFVVRDERRPPPKTPVLEANWCDKPGQAVPPKMPLIYLLFESWISWYLQFRFKNLRSCMRNKGYLFARKVVTKFLRVQISWIWCKCLRSNFVHAKIFQPDRIQKSYRKKFTAQLTNYAEYNQLPLPTANALDTVI